MKQTPRPEYNQQPQVELSCPHCGGSSSWTLLQTVNQCSYCGSVLSWPYPEGEPDYLIAESAIRQDSDLIEVLAMYDAMSEASRRRGAIRSQGSDYEPDIYYDLGAGFTDTSVYEIKKERLSLFRVLKAIRVYAPYQLIATTVVFHVLGRIASERKAFQSLFFHAEAILPGYTEEWNFRDRGLQMSKQKLRPLSAGPWSKELIATGPITKEIEKITRQWTAQRKIIESDIQPISFHGKAIDTRRWWVYRPYYFVNAQTPQGASWFLIDGQFATIAGTPNAAEVSKVLHKKWKKLDLHSVRSVDIRIVPFRCPNCGCDVEFYQSRYQICGNCTRTLEVQGQSLELVPYKVILPEQLAWWSKQHRGPKVWLPFWRIQPAMLLEKKAYEDLAQIAEALVPQSKMHPRPHLFFPAFNCLTIARYDAWALEMGERLSEGSVSPHETTIHHVKSSKDILVAPDVDHRFLRGLFPQIVGMYFPPAVQSRLNTLLLKRMHEMHVLLKALELVYVPAALVQSRSSDARLHGPRQTIEWLPLKNRVWPPALQRTVRRWKAMGNNHQDAAPKQRIKWMTSAFTKRI